MKEGKIEIKKRGEKVTLEISNLTGNEILNLLTLSMKYIIEQMVEKKEERTALAAFIGSALIKGFEKAEKTNDQV